MEPDLRRGDQVRIVAGPYIEHIGLVDHIDFAAATAQVMVLFFGRDTFLECQLADLEKVGRPD